LGLLIKDFLFIGYLEDFMKTTSEKYIESFSALISNTILQLFKLNKFIIELNINDIAKKKYLLAELSFLNTIFDLYGNSDDVTYYFKDFYEHNNNKNIELAVSANNKAEIIRKQKEFLRKKQSEILYLILYKINRKELSKDFFEVAIKIFNLNDFEKQYYKYIRFDDFDFKNYDFFSGGVQVIPQFNFNKYRLLVSFYKYLETGTVDIKKFSNENFTVTEHSFEDELNNLAEEFILKYFQYDKDKFEKFKELTLKEIEEKKKLIKRNKQEYIINEQLVDKYVKKFKKDCEKEWEQLQNELKKFIEIADVDCGKKSKDYFGSYRLYGKEWFIEPFDKTVSLMRNSGEIFGRNQTSSRLRYILKLIDEHFEDKKEKEFIVKDLYSDLQTLIEQENEEFCLLYDTTDIEIYDIPDLIWNHNGYEEAILTINNSKIHFYPILSNKNLLFKKDLFVLKQYKHGYDKINKPLVIEIEEISDNKEIEKILKKNPKFKTPDDVKENVTIRIAEKFEIERKDDAELIRLKV